MALFRNLLAVSSSLCLLYTPPSLAQNEDDTEVDEYAFEEIVVTARKREELLQDIPVSISVLGSDTIAEQNILNLSDLAELVPGLSYDQGQGAIDDRIAALPSIRGISSSEIATNRTKVSSFVDGMPILGSVGAISIGGASQVEVYSGPQSASFGRSTFAGAINYTIADPGDEIAGSVGLNWSDEGTRIVSGSVGGPVTDTLGFQLTGQYEDSVSPDKDLYTYSDGVEADTRGGNNLLGRLVWEPSDSLEIKLTFTHDETDDGPSSDFYATQASSKACFDSLGETFSYSGGMGNSVGYHGTFDCEFDLDTNATLQAVNDVRGYYENNTTELQNLVTAAIANGATSQTIDGVEYSVEEAILLIADAYSVPNEDVGSQSERDRIYAQLDYVFDDNSMLQVSLMTSEEEYIRQAARFDSAIPYEIGYRDAGVDMGVPFDASYAYADGVGMADYAEGDPTTIDETYFEARWASPAEERLRYVVGGSYYDYEFVTQVYQSGYNAIRLGIADTVGALIGDTIEPVVVISEFTENTALFFNTSYDFTDKLTGSIEGRYSSDKVGGYLPEENITKYQTTESFTPRLGLNYSPQENMTIYAQYAVGVNPSGINADLLASETVSTLDDGFEVSNVDGVLIENYIGVDYTSSDYLAYDEETLTNYEIGIKGTAFDNRVNYSAAVYYMLWEDAVQPINLDWDYEYADDDFADDPTTLLDSEGNVYGYTTDETSARVNANEGTIRTMGLELSASYKFDDNWSVNASTSLMSAEYTDFCSVTLYTGDEGDLGDYAGLDVETVAEGDSCYVLDGKKLADQSPFTLSLTPSYRTELNNGLSLSASARMNYSSSSYTNDVNIGKNASSKSLNLTFGLSNESWSGTFYIENVLDDESANGNLNTSDEYAETYLDGDNSTLDSDLYFNTPGDADNYSHYSYNIPTGRSFGARLNYNF